MGFGSYSGCRLGTWFWSWVGDGAGYRSVMQGKLNFVELW
jgi:hypothetical protein